MNIKKNKFILTVLVCAIAITLVISCSKESEDVQVSKNDVAKIIKSKLGLIEIKGHKNFIFNNESSKAADSIIYYESVNDEKVFVLRKSDNKILLNKGIVINGVFVSEKIFELIDNMDNEGNGNLLIKNLDENIVISQTYINGEFVNQVLVDNNEERGFCHRKKGESFKDCNARETSEFCDDLVSTVAYIINPEIAILIAAMCSC